MVTPGATSAKPSVRASITLFIEVEPPVATVPDRELRSLAASEAEEATEEAEEAVEEAVELEAAVELEELPQAARAPAAATAPQTARKERRLIFFIAIFPPKSQVRGSQGPVYLFLFFLLLLCCFPLGTPPLYNGNARAATMARKNPCKVLRKRLPQMKRECKFKAENIALNFTFPVKVEKIAPPPSAKGQKHPDAPAYAGGTKKPPARAALHGSGAMGVRGLCFIRCGRPSGSRTGSRGPCLQG